MRAAPEGVAVILSDDPWEWPNIVGGQIGELSAMGGDGPEAPLFQYMAVCKCLALKPDIDLGDGFAVLDAVRQCGNAGLKMPLWLVYAFNRKYMAVVSFQATSWDDPKSFGQPYPKGTNKNAKLKRRRLSVAVYNAVRTKLQAEPETPICKGLFEEIGKPLALGATLTEEYYYYVKSKIEVPRPFDVLLEPYVIQGANTANINKSAGLRKRHK